MKAYINGILVAFSMFSKIPVPQKWVKWDKEGMKYMMAAFPLVGIVIGALVYAWVLIADLLSLPDMLRALGVTLIPIAITGGIHLDGFADTSDALAANTTPEKRREILKDPRAGAFAVIAVVVYILSYFALACTLRRGNMSYALLCIGFVINRCFSASAVLGFPTVSDGTVKAFHDAGAKRARLITSIISFLSAMVLIIVFTYYAGLPGFAGRALLLTSLFAYLLVAIGCFLYLRYTAKHKFGGMSGDLAGWFLQICELAQLAAIAIVPYIYAAIRG